MDKMDDESTIVCHIQGCECVPVSGCVASALAFIRLGSPAHSAGDLSLPCRRVWRRAIHFFLTTGGVKWPLGPASGPLFYWLMIGL